MNRPGDVVIPKTTPVPRLLILLAARDGRQGALADGIGGVAKQIAEASPHPIRAIGLVRQQPDPFAGGIGENRGFDAALDLRLEHGGDIEALITSCAGLADRIAAVAANVRQGIDLEGAGSLAIDNVVTEGTSTGIYVTLSGSVQGNLITNNTGTALSTFGLNAQRTSYRDNVISANGATVSGGTNLGGNSCNGTTGCP